MAKENDGRGTRRRKFLKCSVFVCLIFIVYETLITHFLGVFVPDVEIDQETGTKRIRRRPERNKKLIDGQFVPKSSIDGIMEGHLHLVDISIPDNALDGYGDKSDGYKHVKGVFCVLQWDLQKEDPTRVPYFHDLIEKSPMCDSTEVVYDLYEIARLAEEFDEKRRGEGAAVLSHHDHYTETNMIKVDPTAVIFHESRCGSTLVSNMLASFAPNQTKVYSEAKPPTKAIEACEYNDNCVPSLQKLLINDVFYLMGRSKKVAEDQPHYVFYKLQSNAVRSIEAFARAMPGTPWVFMYRDAVEVMTGNLVGSVIDPDADRSFLLGKKTPQCLHDYNSRAPPPPLLAEIVKSKGRTLESLSKEEYCAAHLATLCESAIREYDRSSHLPARMFLNHHNLPDFLWLQILEKIGIRVTGRQVVSMEKVSNLYAKGGDKKALFAGDTEQKHTAASAEIKDAADLFLEDRFQRLIQLSEKTLDMP